MTLAHVCACMWVCVPLWPFSNLVFPSASHKAPPVHPAVIDTWHLLGCKFKAFSHETAMDKVGLPDGRTACCEERPVLLRVPSLAAGALLARLTVPA